MRRILLTLLVLPLLTLPLMGINTGPVKGDTIGILATPPAYARGIDRSVVELVPKVVGDELRREGFVVHLVEKDLEEMSATERATAYDYYLELVYTDADGGPIVGVGTGGIGGPVGVDVAVISAHVRAEMRLYDGASLEEIDSFVLDSHSVSPAVSGVGVAGRHGYIYLPIPYFWNAPYRQAARRIARDAVARILDSRSAQARR